MKLISTNTLRAAALLMLSASAMTSFAQNEFYNNGADVYVQAAGLIYVQGEVINDDEGVNLGRIHNSGDVQLTGNWTNTSTTNVFDAFATGTTTFLGTGAVQTIGGTTDTYFNNMTISKSGGTVQEVRQLRNSLCDGVLNLTNDFLNTQTFTYLVANPNPAAIQRVGAVTGAAYNDVLTEGYVTSTIGSAGRLARATSNIFPGAVYFYPLGAAAPVPRFRPIEITPTSVGNNAYSAQFVNIPPFSPTLLAPTLDIINPNWYHFIERQVAAGSPENIRIYDNFITDNVCDVNYVTMSEWNLALWADLSPTTASAGGPGLILGWVNKAGYPGTYPTPWVSNVFALAGLFVAPGVTSCVFPVELLDLQATPNGNHITLDWITSSETNNLGFEVDRSTDGKTFSNIGWEPGNGTTSSPTSYAYDDYDVKPNQLYYYRLRQKDVDGTENPSNIVTAILLDEGSMVVSELYPNPSDEGAALDIYTTVEGDLTINVVNKLGQQVLKREYFLTTGQNKVELPTHELAAGAYSVLVDVGGQVMARKLVVKH
jgi:hypothetical protein